MINCKMKFLQNVVFVETKKHYNSLKINSVLSPNLASIENYDNLEQWFSFLMELQTKI
jgi:hypothetical protein